VVREHPRRQGLILTLPADDTLVLDLEAGMLSVKGWAGKSKAIRTWPEARAIASLLGGVDPNAEPGKPYSKEHRDKAAAHFPDVDPSAFRTLFVDSISVASRLCLDWVKRQPEAYTKQGEFNGLRAYGMLADEMTGWFTQLQHAAGKNVWLVGILDQSTDDLGNVVFEPQLEGSKTKNKLAGIVDEIVTMAKLEYADADGKKKAFRGFVTGQLNRWGYPAKDRSGTLAPVEPPHLGKLMNKIAAGKVVNLMEYDLPVELDSIQY
jgi:hypothetical protein